MKTTHGIAGIDGCRGGWFVATRPPGGSEVRCFLAPDIGGAINGLEDIDVIGVDMPVGIPDRGRRECDRLARKRLSPYRTSSVFSSPIRPVLGISDYRDACDVHERHDGRRMSKQAFFIMPRIVELDAAVRADAALASRLYEIHPELSFGALNGGTPMKHPKRDGAGFDYRYVLLTGVFGKRSIEAALNLYPRKLVARDDVLDAFAVLWSASRVAIGDAVRLPEEPQCDACGIEMAIWY